MKAWRMLVAAGFVLAADLGAVLAIFASIWLEQWLGLGRGAVLDLVIVLAVSYGAAAWIGGKFLEWELGTNEDSSDESSREPAHAPHLHLWGRASRYAAARPESASRNKGAVG